MFVIFRAPLVCNVLCVRLRNEGDGISRKEDKRTGSCLLVNKGILTPPSQPSKRTGYWDIPNAYNSFLLVSWTVRGVSPPSLLI